jgi:5-methylcytosine-specific restriction endonuclease McrA
MACPKNKPKGSFVSPRYDFLFYSEAYAIREKLFARDVPLCVWCQETIGNWKSDNPFTADHVVTCQSGGAFVLDNLVMACGACNSGRGSLSVLAYMVKRADAAAERCIEAAVPMKLAA